MKMIEIALGCLLCFSCNGSIDHIQDFNFIEVVEVQNSNFHVSIEIALLEEQLSAYPVTFNAFNEALAEWALHIPVKFTTYVDPTSTVPFQLSALSRSGIIQVTFGNLQEYGLPPNLLGIWMPRKRHIMINAALLEDDSDTAYSVALHELGHLFGLPHIVGENEDANTGWIVLGPNEDGPSAVMYPRTVEEKKQKKLSQLEIALATHYLLHEWTDHMHLKKINECELTK